VKIGDSITVMVVPKGLDGETKTLFELCVGRTFPIVGIVAVPETGGELFELHVGEVVGQPDYMHSIWIEKEFATSAHISTMTD
jgi:hypothetical protein